jgi:RHS repeat-associated protein
MEEYAASECFRSPKPSVKGYPIPILPGQYYDKETLTHYNYFRDYNPKTGGYIESDPIGLKGGINTFSYALNNPISNTDPSGLLVPLVIAGVCGGGGCEAILVATAAVVSGILQSENNKRPDNHEDPAETVDSISKAQSSVSKGRPSILPPDPDDDDEWEGAKKRPKQSRINSIKKSLQNLKKSIKDSCS